MAIFVIKWQTKQLYGGMLCTKMIKVLLENIHYVFKMATEIKLYIEDFFRPVTMLQTGTSNLQLLS